MIVAKFRSTIMTIGTGHFLSGPLSITIASEVRHGCSELITQNNYLFNHFLGSRIPSSRITSKHHFPLQRIFVSMLFSGITKLVSFLIFRSVRPPRELKGTLQPNFLLDGARHLWKDQVFGPESLILRDEDEGIYAGIHGGEVVLINNNSVAPITKIGQPCGT